MAPRPVDVRHLGRERVICCWLAGEGDIVVDPGPTVSLEPVIEALGDQPPRAILLTHIHLDHAGGTGALVRRWPEVPVYVHERGAPHLAEPGRLLESATRLYGERMGELWGEVVPVPADNIHTLSGGEQVLGFRVAYTPGHASHHVSYFDAESSGWALVGDAAGVRLAPDEYVLAPTPPPDIDLEAWRDSLATIRAWQPAGLAITHFGGFTGVDEHLARFESALGRAGELARETDAEEYEERVRAAVAAATDPETAAAYDQAAPFAHLHPGLARYWRKRAVR